MNTILTIRFSAKSQRMHNCRERSARSNSTRRRSGRYKHEEWFGNRGRNCMSVSIRMEGKNEN